jgi:hypothetical protein
VKKYISYIIIGVCAIGVLLLFFANAGKNTRHFDERITFQKRDKIPYGTYVAYESLKQIFPKARISANRQEPGYWDSLSNYDAHQALIVVTPNFNASEEEMKKLVRFVENGNDVFISTMEISYDASQILKCDANAAAGLMYYFDQTEGSDLISLSLAKPPFRPGPSFSYPGKRYDFYFAKYDTSTVTVLGYDKDKKPNFIHLKAGDGNLYVHLAPIAFTNYFLLHKTNISYYENVLSVISPNTTRLVWDEYFIAKRQGPRSQSSWIDGFLKYPSLKWALLTALLTLLVYVLLGMRRKQRLIPIMTKPKNDSLDFVKTIGRLYHDKGDHKNLARKMSAYFLEHVRARYKLATSDLSETFEKNLQSKTGIAKEDIEKIISFIRQLESLDIVTEKQLASFHKQLETFYKQA